jgi:hypothetical protein
VYIGLVRFLWEASLPAAFVDAIPALWKAPQTVKQDNKHLKSVSLKGKSVDPATKYPRVL